MQEVFGNIFAARSQAICIPTNGYLDEHGSPVMGAGIARKAVAMWPSVRIVQGIALTAHGNNVRLLTTKFQGKPSMTGEKVPIRYHLVSFPTKPSKVWVEYEGWDLVLPQYRKEKTPKWVPGWQGYANIDIIRHSAEELVELTDEEGWKSVVLPQVGCGNGGLKWSEVKEVLDPILDDRFFVFIHNNRETS